MLVGMGKKKWLYSILLHTFLPCLSNKLSANISNRVDLFERMYIVSLFFFFFNITRLVTIAECYLSISTVKYTTNGEGLIRVVKVLICME